MLIVILIAKVLGWYLVRYLLLPVCFNRRKSGQQAAILEPRRQVINGRYSEEPLPRVRLTARMIERVWLR